MSRGGVTDDLDRWRMASLISIDDDDDDARRHWNKNDGVMTI